MKEHIIDYKRVRVILFKQREDSANITKEQFHEMTTVMYEHLLNTGMSFIPKGCTYEIVEIDIPILSHTEGDAA